jgi:hydrogenase maturation protease
MMSPGFGETKEDRIMIEQAARRAEERELDSRMEKQILVAGVGNAWLGDDGFGGVVIKRLEQRKLPSGVQVMDFGSGGLDLAYEVMRGYHALLLIDISEQGGEPGTLYVLEPDPDEIEGGIEDGEVLNPHGMDPATVLRFVKAVHGWPGKVVVVACEPADVEDIAMELSPKVEAVVEEAVDLVLEQIAALQSDLAYKEGGS